MPPSLPQLRQGLDSYGTLLCMVCVSGYVYRLEDESSFLGLSVCHTVMKITQEECQSKWFLLCGKVQSSNYKAAKQRRQHLKHVKRQKQNHWNAQNCYFGGTIPSIMFFLSPDLYLWEQHLLQSDSGEQNHSPGVHREGASHLQWPEWLAVWR